MRLVFIGPPGAGKGTQAERLLDHLKLLHLSTGDLLRSAIAEKTETGRLAEQYVSNGQLVPDPVILQIVVDRLNKPDSVAGVLFDGFPRTLPQAESLDKLLDERGSPLDAVLELKVDDDEVLRRLLARKRTDDQPSVVAKRLESYWAQTRPLLDYYRRQGVLEEIEGTGTPDDVFARVRAAVDRRRALATKPAKK